MSGILLTAMAQKWVCFLGAIGKRLFSLEKKSEEELGNSRTCERLNGMVRMGIGQGLTDGHCASLREPHLILLYLQSLPIVGATHALAF